MCVLLLACAGGCFNFDELRRTADAAGADGGGGGLDAGLPDGGTVVIGANSGNGGGVVDTTLDEASPSSSRAGDGVLEVRGDLSMRRFVLLRFDLRTVAPFRVTEAHLELMGGDNGENGVEVWVLNEDWDATATWQQARTSVPWSVPGCDQGLCATNLGTTFDIAVSQPVTVPLPLSVVQFWLDTASSNHGLLLRLDPTATGGTGRLVSSEGADGSRPRLVLR